MKNKKNLTKKDLDDWKEFTDDLKGVIDKDIQKNFNKTKWKRFTFDLHGFSLLEANKKAEEIVKFCLKEKYFEILLITGKGIHSKLNNIYESRDFSKLRYSVPDYLKNNEEIRKFISKIDTAEEKDGGEGAILIK